MATESVAPMSATILQFPTSRNRRPTRMGELFESHLADLRGVYLGRDEASLRRIALLAAGMEYAMFPRFAASLGV